MHINRVEFIMTFACTGRCKHCSLGVGETETSREHIEYTRLAGLLTRLKTALPIESVMCFGGEPLLHAGEVCAILGEAKAAGIPKRELITNGFFSRDTKKIIAAAEQLNECATDIMLSVDAFHQETIPLEPVQLFTAHAKHVRLHPAWLVSREDGNPWNVRTREVLAQFPGLPVSKGNVVFLQGNALKYLREYFPDDQPQRSPHYQAPGHVTCMSVSPDGDVDGMGNAYTDDILEIAKTLR